MYLLIDRYIQIEGWSENNTKQHNTTIHIRHADTHKAHRQTDGWTDGQRHIPRNILENHVVPSM